MISTELRTKAIGADLRSELQEAAFNHGYRRDSGAANGWLFFRSDIDVPGEIALAVAGHGKLWFLAVDHPGVAAELDAPTASPAPRGMRAAFAFTDQGAMRIALHRVYELAVSLPTLPLLEFQAAVAHLGKTEVDRIERVRIGQDRFRAALLTYWKGSCPLTGIGDAGLLRASHIIPWAECDSDAERLDVHNGLLLAAHWDAAFDIGLASFDSDGTAIFSNRLSSKARALFGQPPRLTLTQAHRERLDWHRMRHRLTLDMA